MHQKNAEIILFLMVVFPTLFVGIRGLHVCLCVPLFFAARRIRVDKSLAVVTSVIMLCSGFALVRGWYNDHFEVSYLLFYMIGPIFIAYLATVFGTISGLLAFKKIILFACAVGSGLTLLLWKVPDLSILQLDLSEVLDFSSGTVLDSGKISSPFLGSILYGIPFAAFTILCQRSDESMTMPVASLLLMVMVAFLSGRTAAQAVLIGTFILLLFHFSIVNFRLKPLLISTLCLFMGLVYLFFVVPDWSEQALEIALTKIRMEESEILNSHRRAEIIASLGPLLVEAPLAGQGIGFEDPGGLGTRDFEIAWLQLIVSYGLIASIVMALCTGIVWIRAATRLSSLGNANQTLWPWFYAWALYLAANLSNPLMLKFDSLWILAVPAVLWMAFKKNIVRVESKEEYTAGDMVARG